MRIAVLNRQCLSTSFPTSLRRLQSTAQAGGSWLRIKRVPSRDAEDKRANRWDRRENKRSEKSWEHALHAADKRVNTRHGRENKRSETHWSRFLRTAETRRDMPHEQFVALVFNQLNTQYKLRTQADYQIRLGLDPENPRHRESASLWFERLESIIRTWRGPVSEWQEKRLYRRLHAAWVRNAVFGVLAALRFSLQGQLVNSGFDRAEIVRQAEIADMRHPAEWYLPARQTNRVIHIHIGPTNSGKTYHALQRLLNAKSGVYAGPLRLLAHEVYGRVLNHGRSCHLVTGDERIMSDDPDCALASSTVEMLPLNLKFDVVVIDEIQMLGDYDRGWAWTRAVLGCQAKEIHLCGEARSLPLVQALARSTGDKVVVHEYKRLNRLEVATEGLHGELKNVEPGDCLVAFSRKKIHDLANKLARLVPGKVAVIYGSLPPDSRAEQAKLFNDSESGYEYIVASNAIGMGLNLNIRRVVFTETAKFDGDALRRVPTAEVKQIGGRAGRYRIAPSIPHPGSPLDIQIPEEQAPAPDAEKQSVGYVTTLEDEDLPVINESMEKEPPPLTTAGIAFPDTMITAFASYFPPSTPLSYVLGRLREIVRTQELYHVCGGDEELVADIIQPVQELTIHERIVICSAPMDPTSAEERGTLRELANCIGNKGGGGLLQLRHMPLEILDEPIAADLKLLQRLEGLHKALTMYLWLSFRFQNILVSKATATHARNLCEGRISATLSALAEAGKIKVGTRKPALDEKPHQRLGEDALEDDEEDEERGMGDSDLSIGSLVDRLKDDVEEKDGIKGKDSIERKDGDDVKLDEFLKDPVGDLEADQDLAQVNDEGKAQSG